MADEWSRTTLGSIATRDGYGLVDGPFGSNLPASCYTEGGIPVIRGSNLSVGVRRFRAHEFAYVSRETADRLERSLCRPFDIVFTKKGTLGQTGFVPEGGIADIYLLSSNQMKLTVNRNVADPLFVYYYVSSPEATQKIIRDSEATGVPKTNIAYLRNFPIVLPSIPEQRAIAHLSRAPSSSRGSWTSTPFAPSPKAANPACPNPSPTCSRIPSRTRRWGRCPAVGSQDNGATSFPFSTAKV